MTLRDYDHPDYQRAEALRAEVERLKALLARIHNFPAHPGDHDDDRSDEADDPASWRHGWICAVAAMQEAVQLERLDQAKGGE